MDNGNGLGIVKELAKQMVTVIEKLEQNDGMNWATPVETLGLSFRATNCLLRGGIKYVEQLIWLKHDDILKFRNMGQITFTELNEQVKAIGLKGWQ